MSLFIRYLTRPLASPRPKCKCLYFIFAFYFCTFFPRRYCCFFWLYLLLNESLWSYSLSKGSLPWIIIFKAPLKMNGFVFLIATHVTLFSLKMPLKTKHVNCSQIRNYMNTFNHIPVVYMVKIWKLGFDLVSTTKKFR